MVLIKIFERANKTMSIKIENIAFYPEISFHISLPDK